MRILGWLLFEGHFSEVWSRQEGRPGEVQPEQVLNFRNP